MIFFLVGIFLLIAAPEAEGEGLTLEVRVEGVSGELRENVLLLLGIERRKDHPFLTPAMIRSLHTNAPGEIRSALEPYGFYQPDIEGDLQSDGEGWTAVYRIVPGVPVRVRRVDVQVAGEGKGRPEVVNALKRFDLGVGDVLVHRGYEEGKRLILNALREGGYLDAKFSSSDVAVDPEAGSADIALNLDTGPRFLFGPVTFFQDFLEERYLRGFVTFRQGEPYTLKALLDLERALTGTRQFLQVDVRASRDEADGLEVPVEVRLTPGPSQQFTAGVGYGTDTGARGRIGWEHRRVTPGGRRIRTDLQLSEVNREFSSKYTVPLKRPLTDHLDYTLGWKQENVEDVERETYLLGASLSRQRGKLQETFFLNFEREDFTVGMDSGTTLLLVPGVSWSRVEADDRIRTSRGYKGILELKGASKGLLSDTDFTQAAFHFKGILSAGESVRFLARADLGTSWVGEFSDLPPSQRFFAGGDRSVRGFAYNSLGPKDSSGNVVGGRYLVVGSLEAEFFLARNWSLAAFFDTGNSLNDLDDFPGQLEQGAGIGGRWHSLIGPI
ncbi:MAG: outer membrane protein assembly factor, partial [Proteobacteria bacterium]|nr:outer membrane protein assembly factor [Pseudomonadota bacterium]